jgi:alcohol dehydrogenase
MGELGGPEASVDAVRRLSVEVEVPHCLGDIGVTEEFIPQMAQDAFESGNAQMVNPRKPTLPEVVELYHQAL